MKKLLLIMMLVVIVAGCRQYKGGPRDHSDYDDHGPTPVPEPATLALVGSGLAYGAYKMRKRKDDEDK